jgi:hypothetical protein
MRHAVSACVAASVKNASVSHIAGSPSGLARKASLDRDLQEGRTMTEDEWLNATRFEQLYSAALAAPNWSFRKETLFSVACCLRVLAAYPDQCVTALLLDFEHRALTPPLLPNYDDALSNHVIAYYDGEQSILNDQFANALGQTARGYILQVAECCAGAMGRGNSILPTEIDFDPDEQRAQALLIRDIVGNPFRSVTFNPAWRTDTAIALARTMYDSRDFGAMPILADALQDVGCENEQVLNHCREPGPHVRGCWVCDAVLGFA